MDLNHGWPVDATVAMSGHPSEMLIGQAQRDIRTAGVLGCVFKLHSRHRISAAFTPDFPQKCSK